MLGYVMQKPTCLSETVWACKTVVDDYAWENRNKADMVEFSICTATERTVTFKDAPPTVFRGTTFSCVVGDFQVESAADTGIEVEISSIAVRFPTLSATRKELGEEDLQNFSVLLIPAILNDLSERETLELERLFNRYIHSYVDGGVAAQLLCNSIVLELLFRLDRLARRAAVRKKERYSNYYVRKADAILHLRYAERLTLQSVAREMDITPGYLSALYKNAMGTCFSDQLSEIRVKKAEELLVSSNLSVPEIAERVGIGDESNLRKRFKQYFGMNLREYRCVAREQTLYHAKPRRTDGSLQNE